MGKAARILLVEDSEADAILMAREFSRSGVSCTTHVVDQWDHFVAALKNFQPDVIVADYRLPGFSGLDAFNYVKSRYPNLPFLLVSGVPGDEWSEQGLLLGATDCIVKARLDKLGHRVKHALAARFDQQKTQAALQQVQDKHQRMIEEAIHGIFQATLKGEFKVVNNALAQILGFESREAFLETVADLKSLFVPPSKFDELKLLLKNGGVVKGFEAQVTSKTGGPIWVAVHCKIVQEGARKIYEGSLYEITPQKFAEFQLKESEAKFRSLFQFAPIGIALIDAEGAFLQHNAALAKLLSLPEAPLPPTHLENFIPLSDLSHFQHILDSFAKGKLDSYSNETRVVNPGGAILFVQLAMSAVRDSSGKFLYATAMFQDVTAKKQAGVALKESQNYARYIVNNSSDMIIVTDKNRIITEFNRAAEETFGYSRKEVIGKEVSFLYADPNAGKSNRNTILEDGEIRTEVLNRRKNGETFPCALSASILTNEEGEFLGVVGISRDITEEKAASHRIKVFSHLSRELSAANSIEAAARIILSAALEIVSADAAAFQLFDHDSRLETPNYSLELHAGKFGQLSSDSYIAPAEVIEAPETLKGYPLFLRSVLKYNPDSRIIVPLQIRENFYGFLLIRCQKAAAFHQDDLSLVQSLVSHCGGAIDRIVLSEKVGKSEARHNALLGAIPDTILRLKGNGAILDTNIPPESPLNQLAANAHHFSDIFPQHVVEQFPHIFKSAIKHGELQTVEFKLSVASTLYDIELRLVGTGKDEAVCILRDISERKRLEREVLEISTTEQHRIGQDLHDGLGQDLTGVAFMARTLEQSLSEKNLPEATQAAEIGKFVSLAIKKTRTLSRGLLQSDIEVNGLIPALEDLALNVTTMFNVTCAFNADPELACRKFSGAVHLYRIAQEAITNAIKHGKATRLRLSLSKEGDRIFLRVANNGAHFPLTNPSKSKGMGLRIMAYRAKTIGATLVTSKLDSGELELSCGFSDSYEEKSSANSL